MLGLVLVVLLGIIMVDQWPKLSANTEPEPAIRVVEAAPVTVAVAAPDTTPAPTVAVDSMKPAVVAADTTTKAPEPPAPRPVTPPAPGVAPVAEVAAVQTADTSTRRTRWTRLWVNVRNAPEEGAPIARVLRPGTRVEGEERRYGWWVVYVEGDSAGFVAGALLSSRAPNERASN
jgi:hypothetical protein